eukprot:gnl/TRDRNA2_/TRDRNA2_169968_c0_seq2.p1 gnl/TRDRNA2_/TRDRNA2_169968_c0~~gnl/TRDRNA2_/TRDRNA2_169968_c0_seq2.p1  ORF type:complete len:147 (+),score=46.28 gnl/TRDRNA2_/TRDRNA2_169968_c0_seq2:223-663(+)
MKISPFVFQQGNTTKNSAGFDCFDEPSPCVLEQLGECVVQISENQNKYMPWLMCMAKDGESKADASKCATAHGIDAAKVTQCQTTRGTEILKQLVKQDAKITGTPTILVNGKMVGAKSGPTYENVKAALCEADPTLKGCAKEIIVV